MDRKWLIDLIFSLGFTTLAVLIAAFLVFEIIKFFIRKSIHEYIERSYKVKNGDTAIKRKETLEDVFLGTVKILIIIFTALLILYTIGILKTAPFAALIGFFGLAIGFGGQYVVRDIINGFFIIVEDQFRKGDYVKINEIEGIVQDINLRRTIIRGKNNKIFNVPNSEIKITVNLTESHLNLNFKVAVSLKEDIDKVFGVLNEAGLKMTENKEYAEDFIFPIKVFGIDSFSKDGVFVRLTGGVKEGKQEAVLADYLYIIKKEFDKLKIEV